MPKTLSLTVSMTVEDASALDAAAKSLGLTRSRFCQIVLGAAVRGEDPLPALKTAQAVKLAR